MPNKLEGLVNLTGTEHGCCLQGMYNIIDKFIPATQDTAGYKSKSDRIRS